MRGRILLIDPVVTSRIAIQTVLKQMPYAIASVTSWTEGQAARAEGAFDYIILSDTLPQSEVDAVLDSAKPGETLILTSEDDAAIALSLRLAGVAGVISRGAYRTLLPAWLRNAMRQRAAMREWDTRDAQTQQGLSEPALPFSAKKNVTKAEHITILCPNDPAHCAWSKRLAPFRSFRTHIQSVESYWRRSETDGAPDAIVLCAQSEKDLADIPRLLLDLHSDPETRDTATLAINATRRTATELAQWAADLLDKGIGDVVLGDVSAQELALRLSALIRHKKQEAALRKDTRNRAECAVRDGLTGLFNRRYVEDRLRSALARAVETRLSIAVLLADIDHFKQINDTYHHQAGDAVLREISQRMRDNIRASDVLARFGGEEFLAVLEGSSFDEARNAAERLQNVVRATPFQLPNNAGDVFVTMSVGVAVFDPTEHTGGFAAPDQSALIAQADQSLYIAKALGRDRIELSSFAA